MDYTKEQLEMIIQSMPGYAVMYLMDKKSFFLKPFLYTKNAPLFSGLTEEEYIDLYHEDASKIVFAQDKDMVLDTLKRIFSGEIQGTCTYRTYHKTRGYIWTHAELKWIGKYDNQDILLGTFRDVSRQIAEDTPGGFFIYAAQENDEFFFVSENMLRMLGYDHEEFRSKFHNRFRFMIYEEDREKTLRSIDEQIAENGQYDRVDYRIVKKNGDFLWVHDEGHYVTDRDGRSWFYVTINDISRSVEERQMLQKENSRLGEIINSIPAGIAVYHLSEGKIELMAVTQMTCELFMMTEEKMKSKGQAIFVKYVHPDDVMALTKTMISVKMSGRHMSQPFRYDNGHGGWKWLRINLSTVSENDDSAYVYAVITDLTAEIGAEKAIKENRRIQRETFRESVRTLLFANPQSLCTVRLNLTRNKCEEWYGTSKYVINTIKSDTAEGVIDNISGIILNEQNRKMFLEHFRLPALLALYKDGKTRDTVRYCRSVEDGTYIWVETVVNMVEDPETHDVEAVLFSEDVNDQELNREIIQKITDAGYDYIAILRVADESMFFRYSGDIRSSVHQKLFADIRKAWRYDDIIDHAVNSWVDPQEAAHFRAETELKGIIKHLNEDGSYIINVKSHGKNRQEGWKQIRVLWLNDTKDWIMIQQTDVTETIRHRQKELIDRLELEKSLHYEAEQANESKSNFISSVSHDMRTPLNAILGYDLLAIEADSLEAKDDYLNKIHQAGGTLLSLINDTLDLQKIETGTVTLHTEPVSCAEVVDGIMTTVKPMMEAKDIHFRFDNSKAVMAIINVDAMHVQEIFINLLSNAAKFTPEGGNVTLSVECEKETQNEIYDKLVVKDDGCGISEEFLPHIFEPFVQERTERNSGVGGSGLGLSIVKRLVELMHGTIEVESHPGQGTVFTVHLVFTKSEDRKIKNKTVDASSAAELAGKKILLCEDNEMNREIAKAILTKKGIEVDCAVNGKEGCDVFKASKAGEYAAILMDIRMPVMDGYEAAREIRLSGHPDGKTIPILAMTADAYSGDVKKAVQAGMNTHLSKPIDVERLMSELSRLIN